MNANAALKFEEQREEFLAAMQSGRPFEMDEESFYYWLEVLPPAYMGRIVKLPNGWSIRAFFGFAEGEEQITAFWRQDGRYFGCRTDEWNRT
jgi:hypothetical protein